MSTTAATATAASTSSTAMSVLSAAFSLAVGNPVGFFITSYVTASAFNKPETAAGYVANIAIAGLATWGVGSFFPGLFASSSTAHASAINYGTNSLGITNHAANLSHSHPVQRFLDLTSHAESGGRANVAFGNIYPLNAGGQPVTGWTMGGAQNWLQQHSNLDAGAIGDYSFRHDAFREAWPAAGFNPTDTLQPLAQNRLALAYAKQQFLDAYTLKQISDAEAVRRWHGAWVAPMSDNVMLDILHGIFRLFGGSTVPLDLIPLQHTPLPAIR